ncbi:hypothetical protein M3Y96_00588900 [Aphelenchoides besseyi]|nr:hypothetical protein M3Y96_00588900 [Aphelenchoides besseyi]
MEFHAKLKVINCNNENEWLGLELVQNRRQIRDIFKKHPKFDGDPTETSDSLPHVCNVLKYDLQLSPYFPFPGYAGRVFEIFLWHNGEKMTISSLKNDPGTSHFKLRPIKAFVVGDKYTLSISYGGNINNKDKGMGSWAGLTYDIYALPDSSKRLTLIYPKNAKAYYNSVAESTDVYDDQRWITKFKDTQLLSTYRLALVIGDFTNVTMIADAGYPVSTLAFPHWINGISTTTEIAKKCANSFARLTNVPYPLEKLDLAAFTFLAEYGECLNFFTIPEIYAFSGVDEGLIVTNGSGHPLIDDQVHFDEQVEYAGPAVIGMIEQVVGRKVFHKAIEKYLRENKFGNADLETLISAFENATKNEPLCGDQLKIREFMTDFLLQPYYPMITVHYNESEGYSFKQQSSSMGWNDTTRWNIPLFVLNVNTQKVHTLWLLKSGEICSPIDLNSTETYIFNYRGLTFGRILYDEVIWTTKFLNVDWTQVDDASPIALIIDRLEEEARTQKDSLAEQLINKIVNDFNALINPYLVSIIMDLNDQDLEDRLFVNIDWYPKTLSDEFQNYNLLLLAILDGYSDYQQVGLLKFKNFMSDCAHFETELETCNKKEAEAAAVKTMEVAAENQVSSHSFDAYLKLQDGAIEQTQVQEVENLDQNVNPGANAAPANPLSRLGKPETKRPRRFPVGTIACIVCCVSQPLMFFLKNPNLIYCDNKIIIQEQYGDAAHGTIEIPQRPLGGVFDNMTCVTSIQSPNHTQIMFSVQWLRVARLDRRRRRECKHGAALVFYDPPDINQRIVFCREIPEPVVSKKNKLVIIYKLHRFALKPMEFFAYFTLIYVAKLQKRLSYNVSPILESHGTISELPSIHHPNSIVRELTLEPFFPFPSVTGRQDMTFDGHVKINFTITKSTQSVWLNSERLSLQTLRLYDENKLMTIEAFTLDSIRNQIKLTPVEFFEVGRSYRLEIEYTGVLSTTLDGGFFFMTYNSTLTGKLNTVLSTVFEPAMARRMFPCFDDPHWKAAVKLTSIIPNGALAFHTTEIESSLILKNGKKQITFKQTPPMSTYLVNLSTQSVVLPELEPFIGDTPEKSANCIDAFESLVGVQYPLEKLDNIDTHSFFHGGGIENFGAILLTDVLANLKSSMSSTDDLDIYSIMCHETAHQWTGDYVTTDKWGSEFLNEAFADYFSFRMLQTMPSADYKYLPATLCSTLTLTQISHDYFTQVYYPIVTVDIENGFYALKQHSIYSSTDRWNIPLFVQDVNSGNTYTIYLLKNGEVCNPHGPNQLSATNPLIFNREGLSYTIVKYSDTAWNKLFELNFTKVDERTLLALMTDELNQNTKKSINPTVRAAVYCAGALNADQSMRDFLSQYKKAMDVDNHFYFQLEFNRVNSGLSCQPHNPDRYRSYLKEKATRRRAKLISY